MWRRSWRRFGHELATEMPGEVRFPRSLELKRCEQRRLLRLGQSS